MTGNVEAIDDTITAIKENGLEIKIMKELQSYLLCKVRILKDKMRAWLR